MNFPSMFLHGVHSTAQCLPAILPVGSQQGATGVRGQVTPWGQAALLQVLRQSRVGLCGYP